MSCRNQLAIDDVERSTQDLSRVRAQLAPLRPPGFSNTVASDATIAAAIREWNDHFFRPRGIQIVVSENTENMPFIASNRATSLVNADLVRDRPENLQTSFAEASNTNKVNHHRVFSSFKPHSSVEARSKGFRMGPIVADHEGFRIGKDLVVSYGPVI
jgi:hypothetical protein